MSARSLALVADIGGTNARFALRRPGSDGLERMKTLSAADYPNIDNAITTYLAWAEATPTEACFAVACPAREDQIEFTNSTWHFSRAETAALFGWQRFETVNEGMQMHAVGASQISSALVQLGESTQQTVHSLKQSNQTIERLNEATRMLRNAVSQFKLQTAVGVPERPRGIASLELRRNSDRPVDEGRKVDS